MKRNAQRPISNIEKQRTMVFYCLRPFDSTFRPLRHPISSFYCGDRHGQTDHCSVFNDLSKFIIHSFCPTNNHTTKILIRKIHKHTNGCPEAMGFSCRLGENRIMCYVEQQLSVRTPVPGLLSNITGS